MGVQQKVQCHCYSRQIQKRLLSVKCSAAETNCVTVSDVSVGAGCVDEDGYHIRTGYSFT